jgi:hypothetical protein
MEAGFAHEFGGVQVGSTATGGIPEQLEVGSPGHKLEQEANHSAGEIVRKGNSDPFMGKRPSLPTYCDFSQVRVHTGAKAAEAAHALDAVAFTVTSNIVFGASTFAPRSGVGQELLAHELAHVVQQNRVENRGPGVIRRVGFFESIARFFGGGTFSDEELKAYIEGLRGMDQIEDKIDSDNKARAVAEKNMFQKENIRIRTLLIQEMLSGSVGGDDRKGILKILKEATPDDRERLVAAVGKKKLVDEFGGDDRDQLYLLLGAVARHKQEPVDSDWSVAFTAEGGGAARPKNFALIVEKLSALPKSSEEPITVAEAKVNANPGGAPVKIAENVKHPRDTGGDGFMGFRIAAQRDDGTVAVEVPGLPVQARYEPLTVDKRQVNARLGITFGSEKTGERTVQKGTEEEKASGVEKAVKETKGVQVSTGQKVTTGKKLVVGQEKGRGQEEQKSVGKEQTTGTTFTGTAKLGFKVTPELSAKLLGKIGIELDARDLLAAILASAGPEGFALAALLKAVTSSVPFKVEGSAELGFKVTVELSGEVAATWSRTHSETFREGTIKTQKEEERRKREQELSQGAEATAGKVESATSEIGVTTKESKASREKAGESETTLLTRLTVDRANLTLEVR